MLVGEPYYVPGSVLVTVDATVSTADGIPGILDFAFLGTEASYLAALSIRFCITQPLVSESLLSARGYARQWGRNRPGSCLHGTFGLVSNTIKQIITWVINHDCDRC